MSPWVSSPSGHCGGTQVLLAFLSEVAASSHRYPLCDCRSSKTGCSLTRRLSAPSHTFLSWPRCPAFSDSGLTQAFCIPTGSCFCSCPATAVLGRGLGFPPVPSLNITEAKLTAFRISFCPVPGCHSGQAHSILATLFPSGVTCSVSHFLFSDIEIYWFSRSPKAHPPPHHLLQSPLSDQL